MDAGGAPAGGEITVNQMYVQYQVPPNGDRHVPVVMVHGCCLSSKTWETTPDGRMGWDEVLRPPRSSCLSGRSGVACAFGFRRVIDQRGEGGQRLPRASCRRVLQASNQIAWTVFRFGPDYGKAFPDGQFPIEAADELYKQMIPDFNSILPTPNPTWTNMAALAVQLNGAMLMGHSESGFFPQQAALIDPKGIRGLISIEMPCADLNAEQIAQAREDPQPDHVRRPSRRREGRSCELGGLVRHVRALRRRRSKPPAAMPR